ncbi:DUF7916 family protein [Fundicoccus culcitae]|uniref:Haloacid dehalogenase-like hydrolase n=1 Tax=Fundicoccus culcitae TaxID=2969821 RepID=A0ABY5P4T6_9LACT|nr:haloacid dehalogenase-like hydrolase [Fundicoccus culcitae]UUX33752.1 haloacid dehalogenase-like hydrolase [Fundicoccus culcitae]
MKRLLSCYASDFEKMSGQELKQSILASEGRTIMAETVVTAAPLLEGITNAEVMAAFGADLIVLNELDVVKPKIVGMPDCDNPIAEIKRLTGRPVGINLEPVDATVDVLDTRVEISKGRLATAENCQLAQEMGVDFIMLTGNPSTGVSKQAIGQSIATSKANFDGLVFAGKMHGAGLSEKIFTLDELIAYIQSGADGVLLPAVGTVPGLTEQEAHEACQVVKDLGGLVISTIGTSQESADEETIRSFGLSNKRVGSDIHHIGDGGYGRMPIPENITALSIAVRGKRHTYFRMAQSIRR